QTTARVYSLTHSQITLAASTLSPAFPLPCGAKRKPLPFGSVPSGTFAARAAAEIALGWRDGAFGRTYLSNANVPEKPVSAAAVIGSWNRCANVMRAHTSAAAPSGDKRAGFSTSPSGLSDAYRPTAASSNAFPNPGMQ